MSAQHTPGPRIRIDHRSCGGSGCKGCNGSGVVLARATRPAGVSMPDAEDAFDDARQACPCYEGYSINAGVRQCSHADRQDDGEWCELHHCPIVDRAAIAKAKRGATVSACGQYRYHLYRQWDAGQPWLLFVMLNPSTADADVDDATIRRCTTFALAHGFGGIEVVNLFAYRATDPAALRRAGYPVGPENDSWISDAAEACVEARGSVCLAWGANAAGLERPQVVLPLLRRAGATLLCLQVTRSGYPQHPLYLPSETRLRPFSIGAIEEAMHG